MAQENINVGSSPNDGNGDALRNAFIKCENNFTELYNDVQTLQGSIITPSSFMRAKLNETCNGTNGQNRTFSSEFVTVFALEIIDYNGIGIEVTAQDQTGFTINSLSAGEFGYIALIEV